jgi:hypothetical protein
MGLKTLDPKPNWEQGWFISQRACGVASPAPLKFFSCSESGQNRCTAESFRCVQTVTVETDGLSANGLPEIRDDCAGGRGLDLAHCQLPNQVAFRA